MRPMESASSPAFPHLDPIVLDVDMNGLYHDGDMEFLNNGNIANEGGRDLDDFFITPSESGNGNDMESYPSTSDVKMKKKVRGTAALKRPHTFTLDSSSESPGDNSSPSSSAESPGDHGRNSSVGSAIHSENAVNFNGDGWLDPQTFSEKDDNLFGMDANIGGFNPNYADIESSNRVMDSAFDFESAASSPTPLTIDGVSAPGASIKQGRSPATTMNHLNQYKASGLSQHSASPFYSPRSREASPMTSKLHHPHARSGSSQWSGRSPSSALEDNFGAFSVNTASPLNPTLSPPNTNISHISMHFGTPEYSIPSPTHANAVSRGRNRPILHVHPTSLKSRVETQIPIRLTLFPLPGGVQKLRLPTHTISKPKFLAKPEVGRSPEILELYTTLVCSSAMQDKAKLERAFARARGEAVKRASPVSPTEEGKSPEDDDDKPLDGGEVKICQGCIQRERKRASRKKQRKPDEDELFQKNEDKRVIVFNTHEIKNWVEPPKDSSMSFTPPGAMQVELPMRIACYCRHQNEKLGFQVILTIKDHLDNVVAQATTNSIMITDDHKTHSASSAVNTVAAAPSSALPDGTHLPGAGVFVSSQDAAKSTSVGQKTFRASSTTDLQSLQQQYASQYPMTPGAFAIPQPAGTPSSSATPRNLSRQASPSEHPGPSSKRRKHSNSGKLPTGLTMTKLDGLQSAPSTSSSTANGQYASSTRGLVSPVERPFATPISFGNGPPTPNGHDSNPYFGYLPQTQSVDGFAQTGSAPNSAHASRQGSPGLTSRNTFAEPAHGLPLGPNPVNQAWPHMTNAGNRLPTIIHKLVPAEGSTTGGTEVTLLGSGFYPGMEVVFGDTLATTTTFWGDKCLNCLTPPALQPGIVPVVFKHEHPTFGQVPQTQPILPKQQHFFRYVDDRELQMYRLALSILGQKLRSPTDAFQTAQRIMGGDQTALWNLQNDLQGGSNGQRQVPNFNAQNQTSDLDSKMLTYLEFIDLDDSPRAPKYNLRSITGLTLLHFASSLGLTRFVAGLLARGANPDVQDKNGHSAMHFAALSGHAHIIHRLRLAGANALARSVRGFTPADIAISLPAHQAALIPASHYRSRSVGSSPSLRRRHSSSVSLSSFWETSSASGSFNYPQEESEESEESATDDEEIEYISSSRRSSIHPDPASSLYYTRSREGSVHVDGVNAPAEADVQAEGAPNPSPPAALVAWRNHLATQIHQFQQSVGRAFPNLPALPPIPALPDYQAYPMMRRITNLVPNRPVSSWSPRDGWWDLLKGNSAQAANELPAYEELYPHQEVDEDRDHELKKQSLIRAAAETALDEHFEAKPSSSASPESDDEITDIRIGRKTVISREQQEKLRHQQALKMKGLRKDKNLYFFWIPMLLLFLGLWLRNFVPGLWHGISDGYEFVKNRYLHRTVNAAT